MVHQLLAPKKKKTTYRRKEKVIRKFQGKYYVKIFESTNEGLAKIIHNNRHGKAKYSIFVQNGDKYQVWARKGDKRKVT